MIIALFPNLLKRDTKNLTLTIKDFFAGTDVQLVVEDEKAEELGLIPLSKVSPGEIDFMIPMGGDGTILRLFHRHPEISAPVLGINLGGLGYMADVPVRDMLDGLQNLLDGNFSIQHRLVLEGILPDGSRCYALNEIVIHRAHNPSLIELALHVDRSYMNTFCADGLIISTPSGSTAYSLAAGGPIMLPNLRALVITPICPHTVSNRPVVLLPEEEIRVQYQSLDSKGEISWDGIGCVSIESGQLLHIRVAERSFPTVLLSNHSAFETLRDKLHWSGKLRG